MSTRWSRGPEPCDLLVVSHPCVLAVNQAPCAALWERGWRLMLAVPGRWRHEYARAAFRPTALPGMDGSPLPLPAVLARPGQSHMVQRRALSERGRTRVQEMFSVEASAGALQETLTTVVHGSGRPLGGRDG